MRKGLFWVVIILIIVMGNKCLALCGSSNSCILMDANSGRILYQKDVNEKLLIASTTKLMTFLVAYENGNLDAMYKADEEILKMYGTSIYISLDEEMSLRDLLYGLILRSGNDASIVIANNTLGGYENFVKEMNVRASELGMKNTIFKNPHGLDEETENYSTSYDMALLMQELVKIPFFLEVSSTKHHMTSTSNKAYDWYNRNKLLSLYKYAVSGKNGYTPRAGKTLVTEAVKNDLALIAVSLDDSDIYNTHIALYEYGFDNYSNYSIIDKNRFSYSNSVYDGELYVLNSFSYPVLESEKKQLEVVIKIYKGVDLKKTNKVGVVEVLLNKEKIHTEDLLIRVKKEKKKSLWSKIVSFFKKLYEKIFH